MFVASINLIFTVYEICYLLSLLFGNEMPFEGKIKRAVMYRKIEKPLFASFGFSVINVFLKFPTQIFLTNFK